MKNSSPEKILTDRKSTIFQASTLGVDASVKTLTGKKGFVIPLIIAIVAVLAIGGVVFVTQKQSLCWPYCKGMTDQDREAIKQSMIDAGATTSNPIIGGDKDEHGCLGPAGYSWCEVKNKCLKVWEEKCEGTPINSGPGDKDGSVACTMDAMMCPDGTYVGRSGPDCKFVCPNN